MVPAPKILDTRESSEGAAGKKSQSGARVRCKSMSSEYKRSSQVGSLFVQPVDARKINVVSVQVPHRAAGKLENLDRGKRTYADLSNAFRVQPSGRSKQTGAAGKLSQSGARVRCKSMSSEYKRSSQVGSLFVQPVDPRKTNIMRIQVPRCAAGKLEILDRGKRTYADQSDALRVEPSGVSRRTSEFAGKLSCVVATRCKGTSQYQPQSEIGAVLAQPEDVRRKQEKLNTEASHHAGVRSNNVRCEDKKRFVPRGTQVGLSMRAHPRSVAECPPNLGAFVLPGTTFGGEPALHVELKGDLGRKHFNAEFPSDSVMPSDSIDVPKSTAASVHTVLGNDSAAVAGRRINACTIRNKRCVSVGVKQKFSLRSKRTFKNSDTEGILRHAEPLSSRTRTVLALANTTEISSAGARALSVRGRRQILVPDTVILEHPHSPKCMQRSRSVEASVLDPAGARITTQPSKRVVGLPKHYQTPIVRCKKSNNTCNAAQDNIQDVFINDLPYNPQSSLSAVTTRVQRR